MAGEAGRGGKQALIRQNVGEPLCGASLSHPYGGPRKRRFRLRPTDLPPKPADFRALDRQSSPSAIWPVSTRQRKKGGTEAECALSLGPI